ncbi:MAG: tRNA (N6-threonylcarbamoyladenosine(37)-N6)-methyltransferase TrmO [Candidatus Coatesbacteria bacterium]|nr:MAG: tRNA (N6-threonylcarbamoyladenosine(37)-N6)-methyltransferase TrmO [Candidatus Coatesbacteria bacterium]
MKREFTVKTIGIIHTPFGKPADAPIQGYFEPYAEGTIEVFGEYAYGLADVDGFSHLVLLYRFHEAKPPALVVKPFLGDELKGVFATRSPRRPNAIGLTVVRLLGREGNVLRVAGVDMLDETPLLDIKPYVPNFDNRTDVRCGWLDDALRDGKETG